MTVKRPIEGTARLIEEKPRINTQVLALFKFDQRAVLKEKKVSVMGSALACLRLEFRRGIVWFFRNLSRTSSGIVVCWKYSGLKISPDSLFCSARFVMNCVMAQYVSSQNCLAVKPVPSKNSLPKSR